MQSVPSAGGMCEARAHFDETQFLESQITTSSRSPTAAPGRAGASRPLLQLQQPRAPDPAAARQRARRAQLQQPDDVLPDRATAAVTCPARAEQQLVPQRLHSSLR